MVVAEAVGLSLFFLSLSSLACELLLEQFCLSLPHCISLSLLSPRACPCTVRSSLAGLISLCVFSFLSSRSCSCSRSRSRFAIILSATLSIACVVLRRKIHETRIRKKEARYLFHLTCNFSSSSCAARREEVLVKKNTKDHIYTFACSSVSLFSLYLPLNLSLCTVV